MCRNQTLVWRKFVICLLGLLFLSSVYAETLRIATFDYPPYQYRYRNEVKGVATEILKAAFARMQQPVKFETFPFQRAMAFFREGEVDVIYTFYRIQNRESFTDYSNEPLINQTIGLFVRDDSDIRFSGELASLSDYSFGLVRYSYGSVIDQAVARGIISQVQYVPHMQLNMDKFLAGRFDILPSDRWVAWHYFHCHPAKNKVGIRELQPSIETFPAYVGFSKVNGLTKQRDRLDQALRDMRADGQYEAILQRYSEMPVSQIDCLP